MNIVIAGGGTGGHMFPGIAVYEKLKELDEKTDIYFIGTEKGIENKVKDVYGFRLLTINVTGFSGKNFMNKLKSLKNAVYAVKDVNSVYKRVKPDYVLGLGGYISLIPLIVAKLRKINCGVMEQNVEPGLSNKILALFGTTVFASFEETKKHIRSGRVITAGNPVRGKIFKYAFSESEKEKDFYGDKNLKIFVFGGSQGASSVNTAVLKMLSEMDDNLSRNIIIYHQTGQRDAEKVEDFYKNNLKTKIGGYEVFPFTGSIEDYYGLSDIVISRAGAGTLSELVLLRKPAVLIPYPYAAGNHQEKNALAFLKNGCFEIAKDDENLSNELLQKISKIFYNRDLLKSMYNNLKKIEVKDSAAEIAGIILNKDNDKGEKL
ncbi:MAG: undecaprenyldiphospho-muramoylpentapeptide beta-N-acetylglucosaminyltransferase [Candidatus Acidulodesulfobacterium sp.]